MDTEEKNIRFVARHYRKGGLDAKAAWELFRQKQGMHRTLFLRKYWLGAAATLLLLIGSGTLYLLNRPHTDWIIIASTDVMKQVWLPDSSFVTLAANSEISYDRLRYTQEMRMIKMTGKAFFEVQRNESVPFSVHAGKTITTVLGTSFQLEEKEGETRLGVNTGKVSFETDKEKLLLTAGMSAIYRDNEGIQLEEETRSLNWLAWKTKELRFRNTPMTEVIRDINETYQTALSLPEEASSLRLTASFDNASLEEILKIINETLEIKLTIPPAKLR